MSDDTKIAGDLAQLQQLQQLLQRAAAQPAAGMAPAGQMVPAGQMGPMMQGASAPVGVMVGISIPLPDGSEVPGYLQLAPEVVAAPATIPMHVQQLCGSWPIKQFQPRNQWGGNGSNWGNRGGQRGGGGWRRY